MSIRLIPDWQKAILPAASSVGDAIRNLDASKFNIVIVCDQQNLLLGTITDGDIRRGLLRGLTITSSVQTILKPDAFVATSSVSPETAQKLMQANRIFQLPVVDEERRVIGLILWNNLAEQESSRPNTMVIMAGGKGVRMRPYTENCPKPLLQFGGKPILEHIIERARAHGFRRFVLAVHYLGHMIEEFCGSGKQWDVEISYLHEEAPLGTAGALSLLDPVPALPFLVSNGDVITDIEYGELLDFHLSHNASATMAVGLHEWQQPFGVVQTEGVDITGIEEKPIVHSRINAGVYAINPEALMLLKRGTYCDMPTLFDLLREKKKRTVAYPIFERWKDIGKPEDMV